MLSFSLVSVYGAAILFIMSLGGLSNPRNRHAAAMYWHLRHGHRVLATVVWRARSLPGLPYIVRGHGIGGGIGALSPREKCR